MTMQAHKRLAFVLLSCLLLGLAGCNGSSTENCPNPAVDTGGSSTTGGNGQQGSSSGSGTSGTTTSGTSCGSNQSTGGQTGTGGGTGAGGGTGSGNSQQNVRLGSFDKSGHFKSGTIKTNQTDLKAGKSANLTVKLIDQDGNLVTAGTDVQFSSECVADGLSDIEPSVVTNASGIIHVTYTNRGCDRSDKLVARTSVDGKTLSASTKIQTHQAPIGSIQFVSVSNHEIRLKGTGTSPTQTTVTFKLTNVSGGPVRNKEVSFALNTHLGGIALSNTSQKTDADGLVSTTISSGTAATTVRVTASALRNDGTTTTALSSGVAVSTGIPDNNSFSLSAETLNIEGFDYDGVTTKLTIRAADRNNNPVPDDTAVSFRAEGGSIQPSCLTKNGACSVTLTSQDPRPADGRVTILATAIGEESFVDSVNSNGCYDQGETFTDLPEAFLDENENGQRDSNEPYVDFNGNGSYDAGDGKFTGLLCNDPKDSGTLDVRDSIVIVLSGSNLLITPDPQTIDLSSGAKTVTVTVVDGQGQIPPADTTISASVTQGSIVGDSSFKVPNSSSYSPSANGNKYHVTVTIKPGDKAGNGILHIKATTPKGVISNGEARITQS